MIHAGAQKSWDLRGVTLVIVREDLIGANQGAVLAFYARLSDILKGNPLYNTPPVFLDYVSADPALD
ncbi:MAG: hypothetical protein IPJ74_26290 [Saprospiraceae bacterium]|nr:hypothetical protein [Saprospiraceae bacterium]